RLGQTWARRDHTRGQGLAIPGEDKLVRREGRATKAFFEHRRYCKWRCLPGAQGYGFIKREHAVEVGQATLGSMLPWQTKTLHQHTSYGIPLGIGAFAPGSTIGNFIEGVA